MKMKEPGNRATKAAGQGHIETTVEFEPKNTAGYGPHRANVWSLNPQVRPVGKRGPAC